VACVTLAEQTEPYPSAWAAKPLKPIDIGGSINLMIIYVDVDNTLVRTVGNERAPIKAVVDHVRQLKNDGAELYLWSAGGAQYCRTIACELGIEDCFTAFLPKPRIMIDDEEVRDWVFCTIFHPSSCGGRKLSDYFLPSFSEEPEVELYRLT
jgi:hypothetical protein